MPWIEPIHGETGTDARSREPQGAISYFSTYMYYISKGVKMQAFFQEKPHIKSEVWFLEQHRTGPCLHAPAVQRMTQHTRKDIFATRKLRVSSMHTSNHKSPLFEGCATALITPMKPSSASGSAYQPPEVDEQAFTRLVRRQLEGGVDALVVCGTTGESPTLTDQEKQRLFTIAVAEVRAAYASGRIPSKIPVIAGTGSNNTSRAIALSRMAQAAGCDGLLVVTPYYNKASSAGLIAHYTAIANSVSLPLMMYHVPSRTGCKLPPEVCQALAAHPRICGLKDASGQLEYTSRVSRLCSGQLPLYAGCDDLILPTLAVGGCGVISVVSNLFPDAVSRLCRLWREGNATGAWQIQAALLPLCDALFSDINPIPVKAALAMQGVCSDAARLPLVSASEEVKSRLLQAIEAFPLTH